MDHGRDPGHTVRDGIFYPVQRWYHQWRYGTPIAHEELLVTYGRQMAGLMDREAIGQLLAVDVSRAVVLLSEGHNLVALELP